MNIKKGEVPNGDGSSTDAGVMYYGTVLPSDRHDNGWGRKISEQSTG
ncbi:hypothetical protein [Novipirellula rosea]|tara:strand:+ start:1615 stop:1755 length:141 start_codon:yes stop_codon:yes gene_type:complete